jgi:hypothetical protein
MLDDVCLNVGKSCVTILLGIEFSKLSSFPHEMVGS